MVSLKADGSGWSKQSLPSCVSRSFEAPSKRIQIQAARARAPSSASVQGIGTREQRHCAGIEKATSAGRVERNLTRVVEPRSRISFGVGPEALRGVFAEGLHKQAAPRVRGLHE